MCEELGDEGMMTNYVEEKGNASLCSVETTEGCSEKQSTYIGKFKGKSVEEIDAQIRRLEGMEGQLMKPELKAWLVQRKKILKQLIPVSKDEL